MNKILAILALSLLISNQGITKQLSKSPFIPDDVYEQFNKLPKDHKIKICGFNDNFLNWSLIDRNLSSKIKGYNSRMDNWKEVEGSYSRDVAYEYGKGITYAMVFKLTFTLPL